MAQLKDTVISGNLRVTESVQADKVQTSKLNLPTASNGTTYGPGSNGQVVKSNGTSVYWGADNNSVTGVKGNSESSYRTGQVNLTAANVGAVATSQGTGNAGRFLMVNSSGNVEATAVATKAATTYNTSTSDQTIAAGTYLTGIQTIKAVTTSGIDAGNIKDGAVIKVGDANSATRIKNVTGTFTDASTVSSGQTAAAAAQIRTGYSAWVDGAEVKGSIANLGATTYNTSTSDQTIASGKYISGTQTIKAVTTANIDAGNIKKGVVVTVGDANSATRIKNVTGTFTTTPSGKTALTAAALRSGYAGFINGSQVNGSMADTTVTEGTTTVSSDTATRGTWSQTAGYTAARTISAATFANTATTDVTYVDISATTAAPVLVTGDYLYINKGYTDNLKISLAKLVPDGASADLASNKILSGYSAYNNDGALIAGNIPTKTASNLSASGKTVTVPAGYYASQATKDVTTGSITNNTTLPSGKTSSGTINRGSYIKIGAGYYNETYYLAQANSGTVTISASGNTSCNGKTTVSVPSAAPAFDGGTLSGGSTATGTNVTLSTTDNGMKIQTAYTAASTAVLYNGAVNGWVTKDDNAEALAAQSKSSTNGTAYYVTAVTMPKDKGFTVTTTADTALDTTSDLDVTNNAYRRVDITNKANGTVLVANSGNSTVTSGSATAGNLTVSAYNASGTAENNKSIVSAGKWVATSVSASGTYYGRVTVGSGSVTQNAPTINTSTGVVTATSTVTAGYVAAATPSNTLSLSTQAAKTVAPTESEQTAVAAGKYTTGVVKVGAISSTYVGSGITQRTSTDLSASGKTVTVPAGYYASQATKDVATATPKIKGGATSGNASASSTTASISDSTNNSGVSFTAAGTASRAKLVYDGAVSGFVTASNGADVSGGGATSATAITSKTYYINGVTLTKPSSGTRTFSVTVPNGSSTATFVFNVDTSGNVTITES